jgi:hypothetical protein
MKSGETKGLRRIQKKKKKRKKERKENILNLVDAAFQGYFFKPRRRKFCPNLLSMTD